jgi:pimeloyl-ACP methyl ester carboxylesterase
MRRTVGPGSVARLGQDRAVSEHEFRFLQEEADELGVRPPLPTPDRVSVATTGGRVSAIRWGERPGITLLHGAGLNAHTWDGTVLALGRDALAVDLPGHGASEWRDDFDYRPATNAVAVAALLDAVDAGPQLVVGHSLGGFTAVALAAARPDLVRALVLVDAAPGLRVGDARQVSEFLAGPQVFGSREEIVDGAIAAGIGSDRRRITRGVALNTRVRADGAVVWSHHLAYPPRDAPQLPDITTPWTGLTDTAVPVLLVRAARGFLTDEVVAGLRERVPRVALVELDTGHNVQEQDPAGLAAAIAAFAG